MNCRPETLIRLHGIFLPDSPPLVEWYEQLSARLEEFEIDPIVLLGYFHAIGLYERGLSQESPAVADAVNASLCELRNLRSRVVLMVRATDSGAWLPDIVAYYRDFGIEPVFGLSGRTTAETHRQLISVGARCIELVDERGGDLCAARELLSSDAEWSLTIDDDELPTPALLNFVDSAVEYPQEFVWGFQRVFCDLESRSPELRYSKFLPFGPFSQKCVQFRLAARRTERTELRLAPSEALILNLDWLARPFAARVERLDRVEQDWARISSNLRHFCLRESVPDPWHLFSPLRNERINALARRIHRTSFEIAAERRRGDGGAGADEVSVPGEHFFAKNPAVLRDELVAEAARLFSRSEAEAGMAVLSQLRWATIDAETLAETDQYLRVIASGKRVVATCDPARRPNSGEIVIIYGNYPHVFENVVVNNPMKRHISSFGEFDYDEVEFDRRWAAVDRIFVINADDRPDRYDAVLRELGAARAPLDRVVRISATKVETTGKPQVDGQIGCTRSHIELLRRAKDGGFAHTLVLEDDFSFTPEIEAHLDDLDTFLTRGYDYLVCLLATSKYGTIRPKDDLVSESLQPCTNTAAYLVSAPGVDRLLPLQESSLASLEESHDTTKYAVDIAWTALQSTGRFLVFRRKFGFQTASFSDIERRIARYLD